MTIKNWKKKFNLKKKVEGMGKILKSSQALDDMLIKELSSLG